MKKGFIDPATGLPSGLNISLAIREDRPAVIQISYRKMVAGNQQSVSWSAVDEQTLWQGIKEALTNVVKIYKQFDIEFPRQELIRIIAEKDSVISQYQKVLDAVKVARKRRVMVTGRVGRLTPTAY